MKNSHINKSDDFVELYYQIYLFLLRDYKNRTRKKLKTYKEYEPEYLKKTYLQYKDKKDIIVGYNVNITHNTEHPEQVIHCFPIAFIPGNHLHSGIPPGRREEMSNSSSLWPLQIQE